MKVWLLDWQMCHTCHDFDETDQNEFNGRIIDQFSMITVDSATGNNHESTLGTDTNDLGNDTRAHTALYSGQGGGLLDCLAIPLILVT